MGYWQGWTFGERGWKIREQDASIAKIFLFVTLSAPPNHIKQMLSIISIVMVGLDFNLTVANRTLTRLD